MTVDSISFPNLGIHLSHVGRFIGIGSFQVAYYGIIVAAAMVAGIVLAMWIARRTGQDEDQYFNFAIMAIILSVIGARIYYVVFSWPYYSRHPLEIFNLRGGGLAIYGGVITAVICAVTYSRRKGIDTRIFVDTGIPALTLGQAIGRWGNFFNREAFGEYTNSLFAMQLPLQAVSEQDVTLAMRDHLVQEGGIDAIRVHPAFLYESAWNLLLVIAMLVVTFKWKRRPHGFVFVMYLAWYGLGRFLIEGIRTDQLLFPGTKVAVSQALSLVLLAAGLFGMIWLFIKNRKAG